MGRLEESLALRRSHNLRQEDMGGLGEGLALYRHHDLCAEAPGGLGDGLRYTETTTLQERRRGSCDN